MIDVKSLKRGMKVQIVHDLSDMPNTNANMHKMHDMIFTVDCVYSDCVSVKENSWYWNDYMLAFIVDDDDEKTAYDVSWVPEFMSAFGGA